MARIVSVPHLVSGLVWTEFVAAAERACGNASGVPGELRFPF